MRRADIIAVILTGTDRHKWMRQAFDLIVVAAVVAVQLCSVASQAQSRPTIREILKGVTELDGLDARLLDSRLPEPEPGRRFVLVGVHVTPSAERLLVFSNAFRFVRQLMGWKLATLPGDLIVYQHNQIHFSRNKTLEISVFDPVRGDDRQIYPPPTAGPVRRAFSARAARAYAAIGEDWFRINNHPMDPERFETALYGDLNVDERANVLTFNAHFGGEPLAFSERVRVTCTPLAPIAQIRCREAATPPGY